jgi:GDPmannose 4,6-dehydratase
MAFAEIGINIEFKGENESEVGYVAALDTDKLKQLQIFDDCKLEIGQEVVAVDTRYYRPTEVELLIGDPTKSKTKLGWIPKHDLNSLVQDMMDSDLKVMKREKFLKDSGHKNFTSQE